MTPRQAHGAKGSQYVRVMAIEITTEHLPDGTAYEVTRYPVIAEWCVLGEWWKS